MESKELELIEAINKSTKELIDDAKKDFATKENLNAQIELLKSLPNQDIADVKEAIDSLSKQVSTMSVKEIKATPEMDFKAALTEAAKELRERKDKGQTPGFISVKTVGSMTRVTNITGEIPQAEQEAGVTNVVRQAFTIRNGANVSRINSNLASWVEQSGIEGGAGMTAEGASKTQLDWNLVRSTAEVKKITSYVKITEELLTDIDGMMAEINGNLAYKIELLEESQLITGVGTTVYLNGIEKYAQPLDLTSLQGTIESANIWDVLGAAITQIRVNGKGEFVANRIFMNPVNIFTAIHGTKDTDKNYINPVTVVPNVSNGGLPSVFVWGVPVIASDSIVAGEFIVADMTKFTIRDYQPLRIEIGLDGNDFTTNFVTIRGEKRLVSYAKTNHEEAFVTDTFADGMAFLETGS